MVSQCALPTGIRAGLVSRVSGSLLARRLERALLAPAARPLRFAGTGGAAACLQLGLLASLSHQGVQSLAANVIAFLLAAQLNFVLSWFFTWRDRHLNRSMAKSWLVFHGSIALMAVLNFLVFAAAHHYLPLLAASALGIVAGALGNYTAGNLIIFGRGHERHGPPAVDRLSA